MPHIVSAEILYKNSTIQITFECVEIYKKVAISFLMNDMVE